MIAALASFSTASAWGDQPASVGHSGKTRHHLRVNLRHTGQLSGSWPFRRTSRSVSPALIGGVCLAALLGVGAAVLLLRRRRRTRTAGQPTAERPGERIDVSRPQLAVLAEAIAELSDQVGSLIDCVRPQPVREDAGQALARAVRLAELRGAGEETGTVAR